MSTEKFAYITSTAFSDPGLVREQNEDSYASLPADGCFLVSDGMGGGAAGEIASQIVEERVADAVAGTADDSPGSRKYAVQQAIHGANRRIWDYARARDYVQMGATLVLFLADSWDPRRAWLCHVGDSRIYRLRGGAAEPLTRDHTVGAELAAKTADASFAEHTASAISHILTRSVGVAGKVLPEWNAIDVAPGDLYLVCSDGVSTMLTDREIGAILAGDEQIGRIAAMLSDRVRRAGAHDNYTFILLRIADELPEPETHSAEEEDESAYLLKISEERIDHA